MSNKEVVQQVIAAFDKNDVDAILSNFTDNAEWHMRPGKIAAGKTAIREFFGEMSGMEMETSIKKHIIVNGDNAAVDGEVKCKDPNGKVYDMYYCDIYELENGKVNKLISYTVDKK
jgi:hypothetical protein